MIRKFKTLVETNQFEQKIPYRHIPASVSNLCVAQSLPNKGKYPGASSDSLSIVGAVNPTRIYPCVFKKQCINQSLLEPQSTLVSPETLRVFYQTLLLVMESLLSLRNIYHIVESSLHPGGPACKVKFFSFQVMESFRHLRLIIYSEGLFYFTSLGIFVNYDSLCTVED